MKTQLLLVCCGALALGSGCATYDSGGTADETVVVTGSGGRYYYEPYPSSYGVLANGYSPDMLGDYHGDPVRDLERGPAAWKQPSPNGQDWTDPRPEFYWPRYHR
jgi:hypothetical protein